MGIGSIFDKTMDWAMEGSMPTSLAKMMALASVPFGLIAAPILYFGSENVENVEHTFKDLDGRPTVVFQSVAVCANAGYPQSECERSQQNAFKIAKQLGTVVSYYSASECTTNHRKCDQQMWVQPTITLIDKMPITTYVYHSVYIPPVIAWQAAVGDLQVSVPLYPGPEEGTVVRKDGTRFAFDPGN